MKPILTTLFLLVSSMSFGQFGVDFVVSNLPLLSVNYEFIDRVRPAIQIGTDSFFEDIAIEVVGTYDVLDKEDYEVYVGAGARFNNFSGFVVPIGLNVYPFVDDKLGFKIEVAPIFGDENLLRGGAGLRYRIR